MGESDAVPSPARMHGAAFSSIGRTKPRVIPPKSELEKAAQILNSGDKVAIVVGQGAAEAADEVVQAAELLGAGVAKSSLGRAAGWPGPGDSSKASTSFRSSAANRRCCRPSGKLAMRWWWPTGSPARPRSAIPDRRTRCTWGK
nr:hypothetical protein [Mycobacterium kansasii]